MLELRGFGIEINGINEQVVEMKRNVLRALRQTRKEARGNGVVAVKGGVKGSQFSHARWLSVKR